MNKFLALTTAFILTLTLLCSEVLAAPVSSDITGDWYLCAIEVEGTSFNPASLNMEVTMTFSEDNTAVIRVLNDDGQEVAWVIEDGKIVISTGDASESYSLIDGYLVKEGSGVIERYGMKMIYGREQPVNEPDELSPVRVDTILGDFDGKWAGYALYMDGRMIPLFMGLIFDASLSIEGGKVAFSIASDEPFEDDYAGGLEGGSLIAVSTNPAGDMGTLTLSLREDGTLSSCFPDEFYMLFKKAE